jgi:hypothetical protein
MHMKNKGLFVLFAFAAFVMVVGLACNFGAAPATSAPQPVQPTQPAPQATEAPQQPSNDNSGSGDSGGLKLFVDQNNHYQIQVPSDWEYNQVTGDHYYIDQFKSPDGLALVENIVFNDGTPFTGSQNGKFALDLLNRFYSNTGAVGDIRVSSDQIQTDGSERLVWESKSGGYSGASYFEVRKPDLLNFLMITIEWSNSAESQYLDTLNAVIESYTLP